MLIKKNPPLHNRSLCPFLLLFSFALITQTETSTLAAEKDDPEDTPSSFSFLENHFSLAGKVELEANVHQDFEDNSSSSLDLAGVELTFGTQWTDYLSGTLVLDWDNEKDRFAVDNLFMTLGEGENNPFALQVGRFILPFGVYDGNTISDLLTEEIFETREDSIMLTWNKGDYYGWTCIFDGDTDEIGKNFLDHFGGGIGLRQKSNTSSFAAGIDIISSIFDTKGLSDDFPGALQADYEYGLALHGKFGMAGFAIFAEYITALGNVEFRADDDQVSLKPGAWQLEIGYATDIAEKESFVALAYSQSRNLAETLPEKKISLTLGMEILEDLEIAFEYTHDQDYSPTVGGTGNASQIFIMQLAYEF